MYSLLAINLDKILECVKDTGVAMQIYEFLFAQQANPKQKKMSEMHAVQHILAANKGPHHKKLNTMADVLVCFIPYNI
mgnify:CR=1 FL=1